MAGRLGKEERKNRYPRSKHRGYMHMGMGWTYFGGSRTGFMLGSSLALPAGLRSASSSFTISISISTLPWVGEEGVEEGMKTVLGVNSYIYSSPCPVLVHHQLTHRQLPDPLLSDLIEWPPSRHPLLFEKVNKLHSSALLWELVQVTAGGITSWLRHTVQVDVHGACSMTLYVQMSKVCSPYKYTVYRCTHLCTYTHTHTHTIPLTNQ